MDFKSWFSKKNKDSLDKGLEKTKTSFFSKLGKAVAGKSTVDEEVLDNLEEVLITSDVGVDTTVKIIERIEKRVARDKYLGTDELDRILREESSFIKLTLVCNLPAVSMITTSLPVSTACFVVSKATDAGSVFMAGATTGTSARSPHSFN